MKEDDRENWTYKEIKTQIAQSQDLDTYEPSQAQKVWLNYTDNCIPMALYVKKPF